MHKIKLLLILLSSLIITETLFGHNGYHEILTPYISPGIQIGHNIDKGLFLSCQITIGTGFKAGTHFEDTIPIFFGRTFGIRAYFPKNEPSILYKYSDNQISFLFIGIGKGKIIDSKGNSYTKNKYWIGVFGLLGYEKIFFDKKTQNQFSFFGTFPYPIEMALVK